MRGQVTSGLLAMEEEFDSLDELNKAITKENVHQMELATLPDGFYAAITERMKSESERRQEMIRDALARFTRIRIRKIIQYASATPLSDKTGQKLTEEERDLYNTINEATGTFAGKTGLQG